MDLLSTSLLFQDFLAQRRYLRNVTPSTIEWYETAFKALQRTHGADPQLSRATLQSFVVDLRKRGVQPISCNTYIKALNAFCKWLHDEGHTPERYALATLRLEKRLLQTLTDEQIRTLLAGRPKTVRPVATPCPPGVPARHGRAD
jgi:site-specific recombinase XerD